jgi:hypothetical protein
MDFDLVTAFALDAGCGERLTVKVCFDKQDYNKPLSVDFSNPDSAERVSVPYDLWQRVADAVARAAVQ